MINNIIDLRVLGLYSTFFPIIFDNVNNTHNASSIIPTKPLTPEEGSSTNLPVDVIFLFYRDLYRRVID